MPVTADINLSGFQPCDIRGVYGNDYRAQVSLAHAFLIGRAIAEAAQAGQRVLIAGDGRASTPGLLAALAAGLGPVALSFGPELPTPLAYFIKTRLKIHASAIVTASHNPARFNGIKVQIGSNPPTPELIGRIRDYVQTHAADRHLMPKRSALAGDPRGAELWAAYKQHLLAVFSRTKGMVLAIDCMHGCWAGKAREALTEAGFQVTALRDGILPDFGGESPDPAVDANLATLSARMRSGGFGFGAALDGDGDRVRFLDEKGCAVDNGAMLVLLAGHLICGGRAGQRRTVVYDQKMRLAVVETLRQAGAVPVLEKSGHTFMRTRMLAEDALLGGETSGHFFWGGEGFYPVPAGDCALFAVFVVAEMLSRAGRPLSALAASVPPSPFYTGDIRGLRYAGDRAELLAGLATAARERGPQELRLDTSDGVRLERAGAFLHLRASVTEADMLTAALDALDARSLTAMSELLAALLPPAAAAIAAAVSARVTDRLMAFSKPSRQGDGILPSP